VLRPLCHPHSATHTQKTHTLMIRLLLAICLTGIWLVDSCRAADRRVALIVGVSNYAHATKLVHPPDDARDMAAALRRLGFEVDLVLDPDRTALEGAVRRWGQKSRGADASLFYYSGHALEAQGVNWILPVSANVSSDRDLRFEALDLAAVLEQVEGNARVALIFLDACREDPFKQRLGTTRQIAKGGLAPINAKVSGTYLAFATAPGVVAADGNGAHSPFTEAVLKYIETPGLELTRLLSKVRADVEEATDNKQVPWDSSSLKGDFYFNPASADRISDEVVSIINSPAPGIDVDTVFWKSVDVKKAADLNAYLAKFPQGVFAELARNRLAELKEKPASSVAPVLDPKLLAALAIAQSTASAKTREAAAVAYQAAKEHRAFAVLPSSGVDFRVSERRSAREAEESGLEACEVFVGAPCVLVAVDDSVKITTAADLLPRTMPRAHYAGLFDPARIPSVQESVRQRSDVAGYVTAPSSKAAAYHPLGKLFVITGAADQHAAEEQALAACNDDPARNGRNGPCFLYASNNEVMISRRSKTPVTSAPTASQPPAQISSLKAAPPPVSAAASFHDGFLARLDRTLPTLPTEARENLAKKYEAGSAHKAIAVHAKDAGSYRVFDRPSAEAAEEGALEGCQSYYGDPCLALVVDDAIRATEDGTALTRDMPRVRYAGTFDPRQIPAVVDATRSRADIQGYAQMPSPKAAALHPWGQIHLVTAAKTQNEAETAALAACNGDPARAGQGGPCYLYASGNQVVFPKRLRLPSTPAAAGLAGGTQPVSVPVSKPAPPDDAEFRELLLTRLAAKAIQMPREKLQEIAQGYVASTSGHKAIAAGVATLRVVTGEKVAQMAETLALERCQVSQAMACTLIATDREVVAAAADGKFATRDMPRARYEGSFDVSFIPGLAAAEHNRADVTGYDRAPASKAIAIDSVGKIAAVSGAASQTEAERLALASCGSACYLYAVGDQVILSQRRQQPRPLGNSLAEVLSYVLGKNSDSKTAADFDKAKSHKAMAILPESGRLFFWQGVNTPGNAERLALETCGLKFNAVCVDLATDDALLTKDPSAAPRRSMPRLTYDGPYRADMVPMFVDAPKEALDYAKQREPKAMAIRPTGPKVAIATGSTLAEAEAKALSDCTEPDSPFPCFLYAANGRTILPQRRTEPER